MPYFINIQGGQISCDSNFAHVSKVFINIGAKKNKYSNIKGVKKY